MPQGIAIKALACVGACAVLLLAGAWGGHELATTQAQAKAQRQAAADLADYRRQVAEGEAAANTLREQLTVQGRYVATLQERSRHAAPLAIVRAAACPPAGAGAAVAPVPSAAAPATVHADDAQAELARGDGGVVLSLAAVSLWNSALAGRDVPAGACSSADATSPACAAGSGLGLAAAWANHYANASSCAEDRARHRALIGYLKGRQQ